MKFLYSILIITMFTGISLMQGADTTTASTGSVLHTGKSLSGASRMKSHFATAFLPPTSPLKIVGRSIGGVNPLEKRVKTVEDAVGACCIATKDVIQAVRMHVEEEAGEKKALRQQVVLLTAAVSALSTRVRDLELASMAGRASAFPLSSSS